MHVLIFTTPVTGSGPRLRAPLHQLLRDTPGEVEKHRGDTDPRFCAKPAWHGHTAKAVSPQNQVAGIARDAGERFGWPAHDLIYHACYSRLPDCRDFGCLTRKDFA